jgi:hypothetical protein
VAALPVAESGGSSSFDSCWGDLIKGWVGAKSLSDEEDEVTWKTEVWQKVFSSLPMTDRGCADWATE